MKTIKERINETVTIPEKYLSEYPPFPKSVKIELTSRCDLQCFFCSLTFKERTKGDIDRGFLFNLLDQVHDCGIEQVGLFWLGEPMLVKELPEYVAYAKKIGIPYVFITTNGRLANPERVKPVFDAGLDSIKVSVNGADREQYKKATGVDAFDMVLANLAKFKEIRGDRQKPAIYASSIFDPNSNRNIFEEVKPMVESYVDQHYGLRLYGEFTYDETVEGKERPIEKVKVRSLEDMLPCWSVFTEPHISYHGHMSICYCDHDPSLFVADLNKLSFREAWHCEKFVEIRRAHLNKNVTGYACADCIAYKSFKESWKENEKGTAAKQSGELKQEVFKLTVI